MYERFTDRARKAMQLANEEAARWNHDYIGTEHVLLGLIAEGSGVAAAVLKNLGVDLRQIRREVEKLHHPGPDRVVTHKLPQVPRAKKVIEQAMAEARNLGHDYVGTEHMLLGLLGERECVAAQLLMKHGLKLADVRAELIKFLGPNLSARGDAILPPAADDRNFNPFESPRSGASGLASFSRTRAARKWLGLLLYICSLVIAACAAPIVILTIRDTIWPRQNSLANIQRGAKYLAIQLPIAIASGYGGHRLRRILRHRPRAAT